MQTPENESSSTPLDETLRETAPAPIGLAPVWHTVLLIAFILAVSLRGVYRNPGSEGAGHVNRLLTYGVTAVLEIALLGWVAFGLRLRKIPLRSLFGSISGGIRSILLDMGIAFAFWIASMTVLVMVAILWLGASTALTHREPGHPGKPFGGDPTQQQAVRAVIQLAPTNGREIACWALLCALVGIAEEAVFRGYLQKQFTAWARGAAVAGVVFSAMIFGAAHGYEGVRTMFMLTVFGALFSMLAIFRRNLRAGIFAHSWHDLFVGLTLALLHSRHIL